MPHRSSIRDPRVCLVPKSRALILFMRPDSVHSDFGAL